MASDMFYALCCCQWVPESPRFDIAQGMPDRAMATLERVARENGKPMPLGKLSDVVAEVCVCVCYMWMYVSFTVNSLYFVFNLYILAVFSSVQFSSIHSLKQGSEKLEGCWKKWIFNPRLKCPLQMEVERTCLGRLFQTR